MKMPEEISDPVQGKLNLFTSQLKYTSNLVAEMRERNRPPNEIDTELTYIGHLNRRIYDICEENGLDFAKIIGGISL